MAARHGTISPTLRTGVPFWGGLRGGGGGLAVVVCTLPCGGGGRRWELRPAWPKIPGGVPWARGPLRGRTSDSPGVRKGVGVPGAGPSAGRGTCGEQLALPRG